MNDACYEQLDQLLRKRYPYHDDVVQETLRRVLAKLRTGVKIKGDIEKFAFGVARNVRRELDRKRKLLAHPIANPDKELRPVDLSQLNALMMEVFSTHDREIFKSYYVPGVIDVAGHRKRLAEKLGVEPNTLCKRANRLYKKLMNEQRRKQG